MKTDAQRISERNMTLGLFTLTANELLRSKGVEEHIITTITFITNDSLKY